MKPIILATGICLAAVGHADEADKARDDMAAAQEAMASARTEMEAARAELTAAAKRMAEAARGHMTVSRDRALIGILVGDQREDGIVVAGVTPGGGAEEAGLQTADLIISIDEESLTGHDRPMTVLHRVLDDVDPGNSVVLEVDRDGQIHAFDVVTTPNDAMVVPAQPLSAPTTVEHIRRFFGAPWSEYVAPGRVPGPSFSGDGGLHLVDIGADLGDYFGVDAGVLVLNVPGKSELKPGDVVRRVDGADVASSAEAYRLLAGSPDEDAKVEIRRKNRKLDVTVAKAATRMRRAIHALPTGKATVIVDGPEVEVDIEIEEEDGR